MSNIDEVLAKKLINSSSTPASVKTSGAKNASKKFISLSEILSNEKNFNIPSTGTQQANCNITNNNNNEATSSFQKTSELNSLDRNSKINPVDLNSFMSDLRAKNDYYYNNPNKFVISNNNNNSNNNKSSSRLNANNSKYDISNLKHFNLQSINDLITVQELFEELQLDCDDQIRKLDQIERKRKENACTQKKILDEIKQKIKNYPNLFKLKKSNSFIRTMRRSTCNCKKRNLTKLQALTSSFYLNNGYYNVYNYDYYNKNYREHRFANSALKRENFKCLNRTNLKKLNKLKVLNLIAAENKQFYLLNINNRLCNHKYYSSFKNSIILSINHKTKQSNINISNKIDLSEIYLGKNSSKLIDLIYTQISNESIRDRIKLDKKLFKTLRKTSRKSTFNLPKIIMNDQSFDFSNEADSNLTQKPSLNNSFKLLKFNNQNQPISLLDKYYEKYCSNENSINTKTTAAQDDLNTKSINSDSSGSDYSSSSTSTPPSTLLVRRKQKLGEIYPRNKVLNINYDMDYNRKVFFKLIC